MRRLLLALPLLASALAATTAHAAPAPVPAQVFVVAGGGWGHGVGLSQWGAYGQAKEGRDYRAILAHYYSGAELGTAPEAITRRVRVLVADRRERIVVSSTKGLRVRDGASVTYELPAGEVTIGTDLTLPVGPGGAPVELAGPLLFRPAAGGLLASGGRTFRGDLRAALVGDRLQLVNLVGLETYLLGVVPGEMPSSWPLEALKAQAVAARTYAISSLVKGRPYDLTSDTRSQLYYGVERETTATTTAVKATKGEILTFGGDPIMAVYSSSSGGRTASAVDVYGNDVPYLRSVDDPWDALSPNHRWEPRALTPTAIAKAFGLASPVVDARIVAGVQGRPAELRLTTAAGATRAVRTTTARALLGLKSSSFRIGVLRLGLAETAPKLAGRVRLAGVVRDIDGVVLERRDADGAWARVAGRLALDPDGVFSVTLRPATTTTYRLSAPGLAGPSLTVRVNGTSA